MISCIIPHYRHEVWLMDAVYGIINQTYDNWHIYIMNDEPGCNLQYFEEFGTEFVPTGGYVHWITVNQDNLNKGQSARMNEGLLKANELDPGITRFVDFHGADDVSMPHRYAVFSKYFDEYDVLYSDAISLNGNNKRSIIRSIDYDHELLKQRNYIVTTTVMVRTEIALQAKFDENVRYGEDWLYWCALGKITKKWKYIPMPTVYYRDYSSGIGVRQGNPRYWQHQKTQLRERIKELYG